jgi:ABC-2 type transport system ATP-binding protein
VVNQSIDTLSKGFRHRTCFAQSIIHDPPVLVLDEPTDGLDPNQKHEVRTLIKRMGEKKAIIFSTHILEEVEAACTRAIIIDRGKIVANGTPNELKRMSELAGTVIIKVRDIPAETVMQKIKELPCVKRASIISADTAPACIRVYPQQNITNGELSRAVGELAVQQQWHIEELHTDEGRLDDVFRNITLPDTTQEVLR